MSDADVFSDSRAKPFQERLDRAGAEPPGLIRSPRTRLTHLSQPDRKALPDRAAGRFPELTTCFLLHWRRG